jgi:sec-independent protein translocase protein TatC
MICAGVLVVAFGICFWQNHSLLNVLNRALPSSPKTEAGHLSGLTKATVNSRHGLETAASAAAGLAQSSHLSPSDRQLFDQFRGGLAEAAKALPQATPKRLPITIGIGEPFATTLTVSFYFALLFSLPILIYQGYAFILPAFTREERQVALPLMLVAPVLFVGGGVFAYFLVLPPAVKFLQGYNAENFDILVQAKTYYSFEILTMLGTGLAFQLPIGLLALQRIGAINASTLTRHWRYAVVICAVIAAALPGPDPVTTALEMVPLLLLYLLSILLLKFADHRASVRAAAELQRADDVLDPT